MLLVRSLLKSQGHQGLAFVLKPLSPQSADEVEIQADKGAPTSCIAPPIASDPRSIATNPALLINSITSRLASVSSPDVKITLRGLFGEKS
jgi:hypothetical protein